MWACMRLCVRVRALVWECEGVCVWVCVYRGRCEGGCGWANAGAHAQVGGWSVPPTDGQSAPEQREGADPAIRQSAVELVATIIQAVLTGTDVATEAKNPAVRPDSWAVEPPHSLSGSSRPK